MQDGAAGVWHRLKENDWFNLKLANGAVSLVQTD
jgi:hypothetical protein